MAYRIDVVARSELSWANFAPIHWPTVVAFLILSSAVNVAAQDVSIKSPSPHAPLELTGTVFDYETKQPLEGAYVVASYKIRRANVAGQTIWCVKTRGMYTGEDGKYWFPVEERNGLSPLNADAIKPGYAWKTSTQIESDVWYRQDQQAYTGHDIFLIRQDEKKPSFQFGGENGCWHAETAEDAAAGVEFLKIELEETKRYDGGRQGIKALSETIAFFERLPKQRDPAEAKGQK